MKSIIRKVNDLVLRCDLEFAVDLALSSGQLILERIGDTNVHVEQKTGPTDLVTSIDGEVDKYIIDTITQRYPEDGVLTEESVDDKTRLKKRRVWIIDPVDGTGNLVNLLRHGTQYQNSNYFSVHIGLSVDSIAVLGVVYVPITGELYFAVKGEGAYKIINESDPEQLRVQESGINGHRIAFSQSTYVNPLAKPLLDCFPNAEEEPFGNVFGYNFLSVADGRTIGSVAWSESPKFGEWDICAPSVILAEANAPMVDHNGGLFRFNNQHPYFQNAICGNPRLMKELNLLIH